LVVQNVFVSQEDRNKIEIQFLIECSSVKTSALVLRSVKTKGTNFTGFVTKFSNFSSKARVNARLFGSDQAEKTTEEGTNFQDFVT